MQKFIFIFSFLLIANFSFAQLNLVPNPSFEDTLGCPQGYPDLDTKCQFWKSFRITPDYINNCSSVCGYYNQYGYQQPHFGQAYAGFAAYQTSIPDSREHIGIQLVLPLVIGIKYFASFYISPAFNVQANIACNKIGLLATTYPYTDPNGTNVLPNNCTIKTDTIVRDTLLWYRISGTFIADSAYQYIVIGSFFNDTSIDTLHFPNLAFGNYLSYYYLDDVCLTIDSLYNETWTGLNEPIIHNTQIIIFPNPTSDILNIKGIDNINEIQILNSLGQITRKMKAHGENDIQFSLSNIPSGIYFIKIKTNDNYYFKQFSIIH